MKASLAIQVLPQNISEERTLEIVDRVIAMIAQTGLHYVVAPFETTVEADEVAPLINIIAEAQRIVAEEGVGAATYMKLFYHEAKGILTIDEKINKYQK